MRNAQVERRAHAWWSWENRRASRHIANCVADPAKAVQAFGVPIVASPRRDFRNRVHLIVGLAAQLLLRHEGEKVLDTLGGGLGVVTERH